MTVYYRDDIGIIQEEVDENGIDFLDGKAVFNDRSIDISALIRIEE